MLTLMLIVCLWISGSPVSYDYDAFQALEALEALEAIDAFAGMHMRKHSKKQASMLQLQLAVMWNMLLG
jgi:hypothetical protein